MRRDLHEMVETEWPHALGVESLPKFKGYTIEVGPNAGQEVPGFGGNTALYAVGPQGGQKLVAELTPDQARAVASMLLRAAIEAEKEVAL